MARKTTSDELSTLIEGLRADRQKHAEAIAEIDKTFERFGIDPEAGRTGGRRGGRQASTGTRTRTKGAARGARKKTGKRGGRRRRGSFEQTAEESVLGFIKQHGRPNAAEVNAHWQQEGRGGKADNTLTKLVKDGQIKRVSVKGERGGRYQVA